MNKTEDEIREGVLRAIRERSAEEIAELFKKHGFRPLRHWFFNSDTLTSRPTACCVLAIIALDVDGFNADAKEIPGISETLRRFYHLTETKSLAESFDGMSLQENHDPEIYSKGRRVWEFANGKGVQS